MFVNPYKKVCKNYATSPAISLTASRINSPDSLSASIRPPMISVKFDDILCPIDLKNAEMFKISANFSLISDFTASIT